MDNPIANTHATFPVRRVALAVLGIMAIILLWIWGVGSVQISDPYVQKVLSLPGDPTRGQAIFDMNCAGCHLQQAERQVGPSLKDVSQRKSKVSIIHQVIGGKTPPMPQFQPNPQDMADLLTYLEKM